MPQKTRSGWITIVSGVVIVFILLILHSQLSEQPALDLGNDVTIGVQDNAMSSLVIIAERQGFFKKLNLNVKLKVYSSSHAALHALLYHRVNLATSTNIPIIINAFKRTDFSIIATINQAKDVSQNTQLSLVMLNAGIEARFADVVRVLQALTMALHFEQQHERAAQNDVINFFGQARRSNILGQWSHCHFIVDLPSNLVPNLIAQAKGMVGMGNDTKLPLLDFNKLINPKPLAVLMAPAATGRD